jgi:hypothetical protein
MNFYIHLYEFINELIYDDNQLINENIDSSF